MSTRRLLALLVPVLLVAPVDLGARAKGSDLDLRIAPKLGKARTIDQVKVGASILKRDGETLYVMVTGDNPGKVIVEREMEVQVVERPPSSPMARMEPMPIKRSSQTVTIVLGPGQKIQKEITFTHKAFARGGQKNLGRFYAWVSSKRSKAVDKPVTSPEVQTASRE
jgi:hypothetical protein